MSKRREPPAPATTRRRYPQEDAARKRPTVDPAAARVLCVLARLGRYWDDVAGVLLIVTALLTLIALLGLTQGALTEAWVGLLEAGFGWGAALVPLGLGWAGTVILARNLGWLPPVRWGRIIALEVAVFALLGLLDGLAGGRVSQAVDGQG
ncbi:MAG: hypothetical protein JNK29_01695, partial [Anaerolineales bacterium]|nr:hypothetical protein [Anaerolineales bacterium]